MYRSATICVTTEPLEAVAPTASYAGIEFA